MNLGLDKEKLVTCTKSNNSNLIKKSITIDENNDKYQSSYTRELLQTEPNEINYDKSRLNTEVRDKSASRKKSTSKGKNSVIQVNNNTSSTTNNVNSGKSQNTNTNTNMYANINAHANIPIPISSGLRSSAINSNSTNTTVQNQNSFNTGNYQKKITSSNLSDNNITKPSSLLSNVKQTSTISMNKISLEGTISAVNGNQMVNPGNPINKITSLNSLQKPSSVVKEIVKRTNTVSNNNTTNSNYTGISNNNIIKSKIESLKANAQVKKASTSFK
jgi:hypothetical protein